MSRPEVAAEPSLDDILASIRKIISEEPAAARPLPDLKALSPSSPLASPAPAAPVDTHPAGNAPTSLARALNGSAVTPLSDAPKPLPLDDDLSDLLEEAPATPLRPAVSRGPVGGGTVSVVDPVPASEPAPAAPVPVQPPAGEPRLVVRHRPFGDEQRLSPFPSLGEAPLSTSSEPIVAPFGALRPASDFASEPTSRSTAAPAVAPTPAQAVTTPSLDAFASFLRNRPSFSDAQREAEPPQLEAAAPAVPGATNETVSRDVADVPPHDAGAFDLGAFVPGKFAPDSYVSGDDTARPEAFGNAPIASEATAANLHATATHASDLVATEPENAPAPPPEEPASAVESAADLVQSLRRPRPVFDAETFRWSGPSLVAAPATPPPTHTAPAPSVDAWLPVAPVADTGPAATERTSYEVIASMPARVPEAPIVAMASDAATEASLPGLAEMFEGPPVDEAAVRESSAAAANALGALAAGLAASAHAFAPLAPSSEPDAPASPALAMPPPAEAKAAASELAALEPFEVHASEPGPATTEIVSYPAPAAPLSVAIEPERIEPGIDVPADVAPPGSVAMSADADTAPAPATTGATVLDTAPPVPAPAAPAEAPVPPAAALVPHAGGLAHVGEDLGPVRTLEDTVSELLRPMLRQWLDENMPRIVEKALKIEVADRAFPPKT